MNYKRLLIVIFCIIFFSIAIANLLSFSFISFPTRWWNLLLFIIYGLLGLVVFVKWERLAYWQKWALIFIGFQILLSFSLPYIISFIYPHKIGTVYSPTLIERIFWQIHNKVTYPSHLFHRIAFRNQIITEGGKTGVVIDLRWSILTTILDLIYAASIGIVVGCIIRKFRKFKFQGRNT